MWRRTAPAAARPRSACRCSSGLDRSSLVVVVAARCRAWWRSPWAPDDRRGVLLLAGAVGALVVARRSLDARWSLAAPALVLEKARRSGRRCAVPGGSCNGSTWRVFGILLLVGDHRRHRAGRDHRAGRAARRAAGRGAGLAVRELAGHLRAAAHHRRRHHRGRGRLLPVQRRRHRPALHRPADAPRGSRRPARAARPPRGRRPSGREPRSRCRCSPTPGQARAWAREELAGPEYDQPSLVRRALTGWSTGSSRPAAAARHGDRDHGHRWSPCSSCRARRLGAAARRRPARRPARGARAGEVFDEPARSDGRGAPGRGGARAAAAATCAPPCSSGSGRSCASSRSAP